MDDGNEDSSSSGKGSSRSRRGRSASIAGREETLDQRLIGVRRARKLVATAKKDGYRRTVALSPSSLCSVSPSSSSRDERLVETRILLLLPFFLRLRQAGAADAGLGPLLSDLVSVRRSTSARLRRRQVDLIYRVQTRRHTNTHTHAVGFDRRHTNTCKIRSFVGGG